MSRILNDKQIEAYRQQGLLHLEAFLPRAEVAALHLEARDVFVRQLRHRKMLHSQWPSDFEIEDGMARLFAEDLPVFMNCGKQAQHLVSLHRMGLAQGMIDVVQDLGVQWPNISTRPVLFFNSPRLAKSEVYWRVFAHQDWRSMQGSLDAVVIWAPLIDLPAELGPLEVIPGSHLDGLVTDGVESGFGKVPDEYLDGKQFVGLPCKAGDIVVFSAFLVHRSGTNASQQVRWSCHFRYNNLAERTFVERGYPHAYVYKPVEELLTPDFPPNAAVQAALKAA